MSINASASASGTTTDRARTTLSLLLSIALVAGVLMATLIVRAGPADATIERAVLDGQDRAGTFTSLVLDRAGNPVVSYYDRTRKDLNVARCNDPDCSGGDESVETVDNIGDVGTYTSLALDDVGNPVVSYYDSTNQSLKVVHCNDPNCAGNNDEPRTVDTGAVGRFTSLALDVAGNPIISYHDDAVGTLKVAHCNDPACEDGDESIVTVDPTPGAGQFTSLELDSAGNPVISHHDVALGDLRLTRCADIDCNNAASEIVDSAANAGQYSSLELDGEIPVIAYQTFGIIANLRVARCNDPACAGNDESLATPNGPVGAGSFIDLALNALGHPVISHYDPQERDLRVIRCNDPACTGQDESDRSPDWSGDVGEHTSIAIDAAGNPVISHFDSANEDLRLVHCDSPNCGEDEAIRTVASTGDVGVGSSVQVDVRGNPVIAHVDQTTDELEVVTCNEPICGGGDETSNRPLSSATVSGPVDLELNNLGHPVVVYRYNSDLAVFGCRDRVCAPGSDPIGFPSEIVNGRIGPFRDASLELDAAGFPVISLQGTVQDNLVLVHCNDAECLGGNESVQIVEQGGDVGRYSSLQLDGDGNPVIAYLDFNGGMGNLKLVHCNDPNCAGADESIVTVDEGDGGFVGGFISLALDPEGSPVISYTDFSREDLKVTHCNDPDCAGGDESITSPDTSGSVGGSTSLAIGPDGNPTISYSFGTSRDLRVLHCDDPNCAGDDETPATVDSAGNVGTFTSLALDAAGNPVVSYYDDTNDDLKVVHCNDLGCRDAAQPTLDLTGPAAVAEDEQLTIEAVAADPDGGLVTVQWDTDEDGFFDDAEGQTLALEPMAFPVGQHIIAARAVDDEVNTTTAEITVQVMAADPGDPDVPQPDRVIQTAIALSQERFPAPDATTPRHVVLARTLIFADALTGSVLTSDGPLLFTDQATLDSRTDTEIDRLLDPGDTVILLGGPNALSADIEQALIDAGYGTIRLQGPSRVETAVAIADHALILYGVENNVAIARADSPADNPTAAWADSISAGGWAAFNHSPILLTQTNQLHPATAQWLTDHPTPRRIVLGGTAAVSDTAAAAIGTQTRIGGANRFATAVAIAAQLRDPATSYLITSGEHPDGWAYALASAGLSASSNQPHLLVSNTALPPETDAALCTGTIRAQTTVIGDTSVVNQTIRDQLATPCSP